MTSPSVLEGGGSCHQAVKSCLNHLFAHRAEVVIDVDLENFFGSIDHKKLVAILRMKIKDERFIKYIVRMLKAGVLSDGDLKRSDEGTPQGSVASPVLANIFAHYATKMSGLPIRLGRTQRIKRPCTGTVMTW